ncbi:hypothetical protein BC829DRAFT_442409 [Chytridium lagenaria]|nr:hypothetical protein BC829DRAFT_442409 [Chytridium lagenaria]
MMGGSEFDLSGVSKIENSRDRPQLKTSTLLVCWGPTPSFSFSLSLKIAHQDGTTRGTLKGEFLLEYLVGVLLQLVLGRLPILFTLFFLIIFTDTPYWQSNTTATVFIQQTVIAAVGLLVALLLRDCAWMVQGAIAAAWLFRKKGIPLPFSEAIQFGHPALIFHTSAGWIDKATVLMIPILCALLSVIYKFEITAREASQPWKGPVRTKILWHQQGLVPYGLRTSVRCGISYTQFYIQSNIDCGRNASSPWDFGVPVIRPERLPQETHQSEKRLGEYGSLYVESHPTGPALPFPTESLELVGHTSFVSNGHEIITKDEEDILTSRSSDASKPVSMGQSHWSCHDDSLQLHRDCWRHASANILVTTFVTVEYWLYAFSVLIAIQVCAAAIKIYFRCHPLESVGVLVWTLRNVAPDVAE